MAHISFSALKIFNECPHKYKLAYIEEKKKFSGNEFTTFGTAIHEACERKMLDPSVDEVAIFESKFAVESMKVQGRMLAPHLLGAMKQYFGSFKVVSAEEELLLPLGETGFNFKGYVDLIVQTDDGKYHIIDHKTCSWGWDMKKRSDAMTNYQLTLYKHFFGTLKGIDPKSIETHFCLLKRTAKKDPIEIFRITSGTKKVENALKVLNNAVYNISKGTFPKNRLNCTYCEFNNGEDCK